MSAGPITFAVTNEMRDRHLSACRDLMTALYADKNAVLESLLKVLQDGGHCHTCGPEAIIGLKISPDSALPIPTLDLGTPEPEGWAGTHSSFFIGSGPERKCGHLVVRNYAGPVPRNFAQYEYFEAVRQHEVCHVLQAMSGRDHDLMTLEEMTLCRGIVNLIPALAVKGTMTKQHAFDLAGRWFLQKFRSELEAWHSVDYRVAVRKVTEGKVDLDAWRADALVVILRDLIRPVCGAFVDTYRLNWRKLLASVRERLKDVTAGTFLEEPVSLRSGRFTPLSCLESIRPSKGLLHNHGLDLNAFAQLTMPMPRVGQVAVYDVQQDSAKNYLNAHPNPAPTLAGLEIRGLTDGCLLAESLPAWLKYDIMTHWIGNDPGTWKCEIVETAPDGERFRHVHEVSFKGRNDVAHAGLHKTTQFREFGLYNVRILLGGTKLAEESFRLCASRDIV
jgi:hypothetical protein